MNQWIIHIIPPFKIWEGHLGSRWFPLPTVGHHRWIFFCPHQARAKHLKNSRPPSKGSRWTWPGRRVPPRILTLTKGGMLWKPSFKRSAILSWESSEKRCVQSENSDAPTFSLKSASWITLNPFVTKSQPFSRCPTVWHRSLRVTWPNLYGHNPCYIPMKKYYFKFQIITIIIIIFIYVS
jgi:hypothetical protein